MRFQKKVVAGIKVADIQQTVVALERQNMETNRRLKDLLVKIENGDIHKESLLSTLDNINVSVETGDKLETKLEKLVKSFFD